MSRCQISGWTMKTVDMVLATYHRKEINDIGILLSTKGVIFCNQKHGPGIFLRFRINFPPVQLEHAKAFQLLKNPAFTVPYFLLRPLVDHYRVMREGSSGPLCV